MKKIKNFINIGIKNFIRDKKNILSIFTTSIILALVLFCISFSKSLNTYWDETVKKLVDYRTYLISYDKEKYDLDSAIKKLRKYEHVIAVEDESSYVISMSIKDKDIPSDNNILLVGTISNPIKLAYGKNLNSISLDENPIICSKQFYPYFEKKQEDYVKSKTIDITNKLGKNINLSFIGSNVKEKFRIVGLYDAKLNHTEGNVCYTTFNVVNKLNKKYQYDVFYDESSGTNSIYAVIDNLDNEQEVLEDIRKDGFNIISPVLQINKSLGNNITKLMLIVSGLIIILAISVMIFLTFNKINRRKKDYSIMKTSGYTNNNISLIYFIETLFEFVSANILSIIIYFCISICFQKMYVSDKIMFYDLNIEIYKMEIIINILISLIICCLISLYFKSKLKSEAIIKLTK